MIGPYLYCSPRYAPHITPWGISGRHVVTNMTLFYYKLFSTLAS